MTASRSRWNPIRYSAGLLALAVLGAIVSSACSEAAKRPNVVILVMDTTRADALSSYGNPKRATPKVDALATQGARFVNAFSTDFWTLPAHASLLTGRFPTELGATSETNLLSPDAVTLGERLQAAGYDTAAFVSNPWVSRERGFAQGFTRFDEVWIGGERGFVKGFQRDQRGIQDAIEWIDARPEGAPPFFLFINLNSAHLPYRPSPQAFLELTPEARSIDRTRRLKQLKGMWDHLAGKVQLDALDYQILRELYDAEVSMVDDLIGRLTDHMRETAILDDTILVVTSDHGENIGEHGMIDHMLSMYETTIRIPLIIRYPAAFPAASERIDLVSLVDVMPTILELAGIDPGDLPIRGRSLVASDAKGVPFVIAENDRPLNGIALLQSKFPDFDTTRIDRKIRMLRTARHKLIAYSDGQTELYDLEADPDETRDLSETMPDLRDTLLELLNARLSEDVRGNTGELFESQDPQALEQLRALGYIE